MGEAGAEDVVIVSGPPGAGKTTVAAILARDPDRAVHFETDQFYRSVIAGFIPPHLPESHQQNVTLLTIIADTAVAYARSGYRVYWDGVVGPWFLDLVLGRLAGAGIGAHYLVLRTEPEVTVARAVERDGTAETSGAAVMADRFAALGRHESHVVDASGTPNVVADRCRAAIASGRCRLSAPPWVDPGWPVSVKGVVGWDGRWVVLGDRRGRLELPGGRIEAGDPDPETTLRREMAEELGIEVEVGPVIDTWFRDGPTGRVVIVVFACRADRPDELRHSSEHDGIVLGTIEELADGPLPDRMVEAVRRADLVSGWPDRPTRR